MAAAEPQAQAPTASGAAAAPPAGGDAAAGRLVFRKCQACHSMEPGKTLLGPSLAGIVGRKAGADANYNYSPAMKQANIVWDAKSLDAYLADPQKVVPGNKMPFPGLKTEQDRADVIAFFAARRRRSSSSGGAATRLHRPARRPLRQPSGAATATNQAPQPAPKPASATSPDANYTLRSGIAEGRMVYIGVGGAIDGKVNPVLTAAEGQVVQLTLINGEGAEHDIVFPDQNAQVAARHRQGRQHDDRLPRQPSPAISSISAASPAISSPACRANSSSRRGRRRRRWSRPTSRASRPTCRRRSASASRRRCASICVSVEVEGRLAEGTTFGYWTFNGKVPGPFIRVRVGDTIDIHLKNSADSAMIHSVDFHAATGPGGGAAALQVDPGDEKSMTWKALVPGLYVYHCATPMVAEHIANGMYGLILVEPEEGLPKVDREFYVMQGEIYTDVPYGQHGSAEFSVEKLLNERPEYFVFNGSVGALSKLHPLQAKVGETVRIFFGVGGPNFTSSFHVIGEIFDKVYALGGVLSPPLEGIQTVSVAPGGAVDHRVQDQGAGQLHPGRSRAGARRARPGRHPARRGSAQPGDLQRPGDAGHGALAHVLSMKAARSTAARSRENARSIARRREYAGLAFLLWLPPVLSRRGGVGRARRRVVAAAIFRPSETADRVRHRSTGTSMR